MRVLFTTNPGSGHFSPLIPLARALQGSGHEVAVATAESFGDVVRRAGFEVLPAGLGLGDPALGRLFDEHPEARDMPTKELGDVDVVVTVGPGDPAALEPVPANARVERFIPQDELLPFCAAVVSNGGAGSTMGALAAGVPLLIVPAMPASQTRNAQAVVRCGAGRTLERDACAPDAVRREVRRLLDDPSYGQVARTIADEIAAMPEPAELIPAVEALSAEPRIR